MHSIISKRLGAAVIALLAIGLVYYFFIKYFTSPENIGSSSKVEVVATSSVQNQLPTTSTSTDNFALDDCSQEVPIELIDDVAINLDRTATLYWFDGTTQQNISRKFKFDPKTDFAGCSESVKKKLRELDEVTKDAYGDEYNKLFID